MKPGKGQVWAGDGDVLEVESFDGAYAVVFSRQFQQQQLINGGHFGRRFQLVYGPDSTTAWHQLWVEVAAEVPDEQTWIGEINAALLRGGKGFVQREPPYATYARGEQGLYTNIGGPSVMREQMERLLRDFDLPSLSLGILSSTAEVAGVPGPAFSIFETEEGRRADYELVPEVWTSPIRPNSPSTTRRSPPSVTPPLTGTQPRN